MQLCNGVMGTRATIFLLGVLLGLFQVGLTASDVNTVPMLNDGEYLLSWALFDWANPSTAARVIINYAEQGGDASLLGNALQRFNVEDQEAMFMATSVIDQSISNGTENTLVFVAEAFDQLYSDAYTHFTELFKAAIRSDDRSPSFAIILDMFVRRNGCAAVEQLLEDLSTMSRSEGKMETFIQSFLRKSGPAQQCETCTDVQSGDESCANRQSYGQCEEYWMLQGYNCALTCGFCEYIAPEDKPQAGDLEQIASRSTKFNSVRGPSMKEGVNKEELVFGSGEVRSASQADKIAAVIASGGMSAPTTQQSASEEQKAKSLNDVPDVPSEAEAPVVPEVPEAPEVPTTQIGSNETLAMLDNQQEVDTLVSTLSGLLGGEGEPGAVNGNDITIEAVFDDTNGLTQLPEEVVEQVPATVTEAIEAGDMVAAAEIFSQQLLVDKASAQAELASAINNGYSDSVSQLIAKMITDDSVLTNPFSKILAALLVELGEPVSVSIANGVIIAASQGEVDSATRLLLQILDEGGSATINMVLGIEKAFEGSNCEIMINIMQIVQQQAQDQSLQNAQLSLLMLGTKLSDGCASVP